MTDQAKSETMRPGDLLDGVAATETPDYVVAVPSYKRTAELAAKTLATIERHEVDPARVTVFVANDEEAIAYRAMIAERDGPAYAVVQALPGLLACRQWYQREHYAEGTPIINMDDDVAELVQRTPEGKLAPFEGRLDDVARIGFGLCEASGAKLWGITAVANGFYMADEAVVGLRYVCGIFHGCYAGDPVVVDAKREPTSSGEDFETTLRSFEAHGNVVRINWLAPKTTYFAPGGMQAELGGKAERDADHTSALEEIAARFPDWATVKRKADGTTNLRLKPVTAARAAREPLERAAKGPSASAEPRTAEPESGMRVEYRRPRDLVVAERNPKGHADDELQASLERWGYTEPIIEDSRTGRLVAGHGRRQMLMAAEEAGADVPDGVRLSPEGWWLAPVICGWSSATDRDAETFLLASNRLVELGEWDADRLAASLEDGGVKPLGDVPPPATTRATKAPSDRPTTDVEDSYGERKDKYDDRTVKRFVFDLTPQEAQAAEAALKGLSREWGTERPATALRAVLEASGGAS